MPLTNACAIAPATRALPGRKDVVIEQSGLCCAAGATVEAVLAAQIEGSTEPAPLPFPSEWLPHGAAYRVAEPDLRQHLYDRKAVRTMEKQARLALAAALACAGGRNGDWPDRSRVGLFMGMPSVDEPVPSWEALSEIGGGAGHARLLQTFLTHTAPMSGLVLLNSTACSHIASQFGLTGTTGVFSPWADAGLQAVIEALWSIRGGDNEAALVGAVAPTINPFLYLHYEAQGVLEPEAAPPISGEGAAFITLRSAGQAPAAACIGGYGRCFAATPEESGNARLHSMRQALAQAGIRPADVDWVLFDPCCGRAGPAGEQAALQALFGTPPLGAWHQVCGYLGPAMPLLNLAMAAAAIAGEWRVRVDPQGHLIEREAFPVRHVLINASGFEGQLVSMVVSRYDND